MAKKKGKIRKMFKKMGGTSNLETSFADILTEQGIKFEQHFIFKKREFDFLLTDYNILIETHGCFFHCCKTHNPEAKYSFQRKNLKNDQYKIKIVKFDLTYNLLIIWEHEMKDTSKVVKKLNEFMIKHKKLING
jgi:G:T-mismatch repair DNA endonuclease (very short patch repair protein)